MSHPKNRTDYVLLNRTVHVLSTGESRELAVLLSMWYQTPAYFRTRDGTPTNMVRALRDGNRAEAWYEIRYGSSKDGKDGAGVVIRRYAESEVFGLYDNPSSVSPAEAVRVYQMLTAHRNEILSYEARFGVALDGTLGTTRVAAYSNLPPLYAANEKYQLTGTPDAVKAPHDAFESAKLALLEDLRTGYPSIAATLTASDYHYAAIQIDPGRGASQGSNWFDPNHGATLISTEYDTAGNEREVKNILIGEGGDDYLLGGKGDDILIGGLGNDVYYYREGDGNDRIIEEREADGSIGARMYFIPAQSGSSDAQLVAGVFQKDPNLQNTWKSPDGVLTFTHNSPWKIVLPDGGEIDLGDTLSAGDFGIQLRDAPVAPPTTLLFAGDLEPLDGDPFTAGIQPISDGFGNYVRDPNLPAPDRADVFYDSPDNDEVQGRGGDDWIEAWRGGDDRLDGGAGRDMVLAGSGHDLVIGGADADWIFASNGDDYVAVNEDVAPAAKTVASRLPIYGP